MVRSDLSAFLQRPEEMGSDISAQGDVFLVLPAEREAPDFISRRAICGRQLRPQSDPHCPLSLCIGNIPHWFAYKSMS